MKHRTNIFAERVKLFGGKILGTSVDPNSPIICCCKRGHVFPLLPRLFLLNNQWCLKCKRSKKEEIIEKTLKELGLSFIQDYFLPEKPNYSFPFFFKYQGERYLIVYNSLEENALRDLDDLTERLKQRDKDEIKVRAALKLGYMVILLDRKNVNYAKEVILSSLAGVKKVYSS